MRDYFYGWYMKCQSDTQTLAVIPAVHRNKQQRTWSIQIITKENVWKAVFSGDLFRREKYAWTHCFFKDGSLMLSVADIPVAGRHFTGIIGVVLWQGKEYRLATYWGARAVRIENGRLRIVQGDMELEVCLLESDGKPLKAP